MVRPPMFMGLRFSPLLCVYAMILEYLDRISAYLAVDKLLN